MRQLNQSMFGRDSLLQLGVYVPRNSNIATRILNDELGVPIEYTTLNNITKVSHLPFYRLSRIIKHCNILIDNLLTSRK